MTDEPTPDDLKSFLAAERDLPEPTPVQRARIAARLEHALDLSLDTPRGAASRARPPAPTVAPVRLWRGRWWWLSTLALGGLGLVGVGAASRPPAAPADLPALLRPADDATASS